MIENLKIKQVLDPRVMVLHDSACETVINSSRSRLFNENCVFGKVDSLAITCAYLRKLILVILLFGFFCSCSSNKGSKIEIIGNIKNIPASKIYLTDAYLWNKFIDSSSVINGKFQFTLDTFKVSEPFVASICVLIEGKKIEQLSVFDYKRTNKSDTFSHSGFMLSWGITELYGDYNDRFHRVSIKPNPENDLFFDVKINSLATLANIKELKKAIKKNQSSYYLLQKMYENRRFYKTSDIESSLSLFDERIQESPTASLLKIYAANLTKNGEPFFNSEVIDMGGEKRKVFTEKTTSKLTMLIFWASWCAPCRLEIPELKQIHELFATENFEMKSISIDEDKSSWKQAIQQEKMNWEQYFIPSSDMLKFKAQFAITAVPVVIFVDSNHIELKRFVGYTKENSDRYIKFIESYLTK